MSNLLPQQEKKQIKKLFKKRFVTIIALIFSTAGIIASISMVPTFIYSKDTENFLLNKKAQLAGKETSGLEKSLTEAINDINTRLQVFSDGPIIFPITNTVLDPILKIKSSQIFIDKFTGDIDPKKKGEIVVTVSGTASNREALLRFSGDIGKIDGVSSVSVPISSFLRNSNVSFAINFSSVIK